MTKEELTWVATVFDCEGCISEQKSQYVRKNGEISDYGHVIIQIGHCSLDLITRIHELTGMGKLYGHNYDYSYRFETERKQVYWWKITKRARVLEFIELIWNEWLSEYRRETIIRLGVAPMAKHAHRLMLNQKKTWRCTLPGCSYFIHVGLAHILPGRQSVCWECGEIFTLDERALQDDQPICDDCYGQKQGMKSSDEINEIVTAKLALARAGVKKPSELSHAKLASLKMMGLMTDRAIEALENDLNNDEPRSVE